MSEATKRTRTVFLAVLSAMCVLPLAVSSAATSPVALLTAVTVSRSGGSDRVLFTFRSRPSSVHSRYVTRQALTDVSGRRVTVAGSAFLVLVATPASGVDLSGASPVATYHGLGRIRAASTRHIRAVVRLEDFEGVLDWAVGLDARRPYTVERRGTLVILSVR